MIEFHKHLFLEIVRHRKQKKKEIVCRVMVDHDYTLEEQEALYEAFYYNNRRPLTDDQVRTTLLAASLAPEEFDIPF